MQFEIEKNAATGSPDGADGFGPGGGVELKSDLEQAGMRRQFAHKPERVLEGRHVERDDDAFLRAGGSGLPGHAVPWRMERTYAVFRAREGQFIFQNSRPAEGWLSRNRNPHDAYLAAR